MVTLRQFIEQGEFGDFRILAGESGLDKREVKTVCVIDTPDIEGWIFGGEFLLSSGFIFRDHPARLRAVIETASREGAAGLGIKTGHHMLSVPADALRAANRLGFPLVSVPLHYAHTEIIKPVSAAGVGDSSSAEAEDAGLCDEFKELLLAGGKTDDVLALLQRRAKCDILFVDARTGTRLAHAREGHEYRLPEEESLPSLQSRFRYETLSLDGRAEAYLFVDNPKKSREMDLLLREALDALSLLTRWQRERESIERRMDTQFVQDVLYRRFRQSSEIRSRARALGYDLTGRQVVAVLGIDAKGAPEQPSESRARAFAIFRDMLNSLWQRVPYCLLDEGLTFILSAPASDDAWQKRRREVADFFSNARSEVLNKTGLTLLLGFGDLSSNVVDCDTSFRQAKWAISIARSSICARGITFWQDLGVYKLLSTMQDNEDARNFVEEQIGPLLPLADSLLATLFSAIKNNWQYAPVAQEMNLHYNTVKYRLGRIAEIIGADLDSSVTRMSLALAMELYLLAEGRKGDLPS